MQSTLSLDDISVQGPVTDAFAQILTPEALMFMANLAYTHEENRRALLDQRQVFQKRIDQGHLPDFLPETEAVRKGDWTIAPIPADLQDRRVEITGPVDRKMVINALNSGAKTFMADFEDSHAPTWDATLQGQINLRDAVNGNIEFLGSGDKIYQLNAQTATLIVRPRGWHLIEKHITVKGRPVSASIFDFALFLYHNATTLLQNGSGPYFYLPKMESHLEARLWNDIFIQAQELLELPPGTIKATVLVETLPAAFEMDEILYELKDHIVGLNCGRWDYIFSFIKRFRNVPAYIFPDRVQITMTRHCMHAYSLLAIKTCHRRGALAIGGMAAQIPIKNDPDANDAALSKVREDKVREATDGHDGTWVAHPGLVSVALEQFDKIMPQTNQINKLREDVEVSSHDLLKLPQGSITEEGLRTNITVGIQYLAAWLSGNGCVPIYNLMEDAATAEISRTQVWQWIHHPQGILKDGRNIDIDLFHNMLAEEMQKIKSVIGETEFETGKYALAARLFAEIITNDELEEFLTIRAYEYI